MKSSLVSAFIVLVTLLTTACAPPPAVKSSMTVARVDAFPKCLTVETPKIALRDRKAFDDAKDQREFDAELRVTQIYLAERLAATLRTETGAFPIKRKPVCDSGMRLSSTIRDFNPPGMLGGSLSMRLEVEFALHSEANEKRAEITLAHGRGRNGVAMVAGLAGAPVGTTDSLTAASDQFAEAISKRLAPALHLDVKADKTNR
jgi:hypothetical protein